MNDKPPSLVDKIRQKTIKDLQKELLERDIKFDPREKKASLVKKLSSALEENIPA